MQSSNEVAMDIAVDWSVVARCRRIGSIPPPNLVPDLGFSCDGFGVPTFNRIK